MIHSINAKLIQSLLVLPSTITCAVLSSAAVVGTAQSFLRTVFYPPEPKSASLFFLAPLLLGFLAFFAAICAGIALLWFLIWKGPSYFNAHKAQGIIAVIVAVISLSSGAWIAVGAEEMAPVLVFGAPVVVGLVHGVRLAVALWPGSTEAR